MSTDTIFAEVLAERGRQQEMFSPEHDDSLSAERWITILARHVGLAADDGGTSRPDRLHRQLVRLAAVALAALQSEARKAEAARLLGEAKRRALWQRIADERGEPMLLVPHRNPARVEGYGIPYAIAEAEADDWERKNSVGRFVPHDRE